VRAKLNGTIAPGNARANDILLSGAPARQENYEFGF
jgi:hypothetical protein